MRKSSIHSHNNLVLVPPHKLPDYVIYHNYGKTYVLRIRVDIWTSMDVVTEVYGLFSHISN